MDTFSQMIDQADTDLDDNSSRDKRWNPDSELGQWASMLISVTGSEGIDENPMSSSAANIHAVTKCASEPERVVEALQGFTSKRVIRSERDESDTFSDIVCESEPRSIGVVDDETRGNLYEIFGKGISDADISAIVSNADSFIEFIQNNHPELGIQLAEGVRDGYKAARAGMPKPRDGHVWRKNQAGEWEEVRGHASSGKFWSPDNEGMKQRAGAIAGKTANLATRHIPNMYKKTNEVLSKYDPRYASGKTKEVYDKIGGFAKGAGRLVKNAAGILATGPEYNAGDSSNNSSNNTPEAPLVVGDRVKFIDGNGEEKEGNIISIMQTHTGIEAEVQYTDSSGQSNTESMEIAQLTRVNENLNMKTFSSLIKQKKQTLTEAGEEATEEELPPEEPVEEPPPVPPAPEPEEELVPDDLDKMQVDMLELVRRALVVNPNDIDRETFAKITTRVNFDNIDILKPLLNKIVGNHYPDQEFGDIEPGPGV